MLEVLDGIYVRSAQPDHAIEKERAGRAGPVGESSSWGRVVVVRRFASRVGTISASQHFACHVGTLHLWHAFCCAAFIMPRRYLFHLAQHLLRSSLRATLHVSHHLYLYLCLAHLPPARYAFSMITTVHSIRAELAALLVDQAEFLDVGYSTRHLGLYDAEWYTEAIRHQRIILEELFWDIPLGVRGTGASFARGMLFVSVNRE